MTLSTVSSETDPTHTLQGDNAASRQSRAYSLRPFIQTLTVADVESCTMLEHAAFPPAEQASQEIVSWSDGLSQAVSRAHVAPSAPTLLP
jgi:hypothetical protein